MIKNFMGFEIQVTDNGILVDDHVCKSELEAKAYIRGLIAEERQQERSVKDHSQSKRFNHNAEY